MKKLFLLSSLVLSAFSLTACVSPSIPTGSYVAQSYNKVEGNVIIGDFSYLPSEYGNVRSNQIQNTAMGSILLDDSVANLVRQATALELRQSGINVGSGNIKLDGFVKQFTANDLGFDIDWNYKVNYRITNLKNSSIILDKDYFVSEKTPKLAASLSDIAQRIYKPISLGFKKFIDDPDTQKVLKSY